MAVRPERRCTLVVLQVTHESQGTLSPFSAAPYRGSETRVVAQQEDPSAQVRSPDLPATTMDRIPVGVGLLGPGGRIAHVMDGRRAFQTLEAGCGERR